VVRTCQLWRVDASNKDGQQQKKNNVRRHSCGFPWCLARRRRIPGNDERCSHFPSLTAAAAAESKRTAIHYHRQDQSRVAYGWLETSCSLLGALLPLSSSLRRVGFIEYDATSRQSVARQLRDRPS